MQTPSGPVVESKDLRRVFDDIVAVDGISISVPAGTILGVIGPSGSGKTTLMRMLTGTLKPTSGSVRVLGEEPVRFRPRTREQLGYMPQQFVLYPELTAAENVSFVASLFGMLWPRRRRRVREALQLVQLWDARDRRARQMSGGMQRRLALACALVHEPALLFVDEPSAGLDPLLRQTVWAEFQRLREDGRTLLVTTQYVGEAEYCDTVALVAGGKLVAWGSPGQLRLEAFGGAVVELETAAAIDGVTLQDVPGVRQVQQHTPRKLMLVVDDAGAVTPRLIDAVREQGNSVASSSEYRPSFDEVFANLVERTTEQRPRPFERGSHVLRAA